MNLDQLGPAFEANKVPILATAAAAVGGFALYMRHKNGSSSTPAQGVATAPSYSSGGQAAVATGAAGGVYDSTSSDLYSALQPQLEAMQQQLNNVPLSAPPAASTTPIASTLYAPSDSQNYVLYQNGTVAQVQNDGSQLGLTYDQWEPLRQAGAKVGSTVSSQAPVGAYYETAGNLAAVKPATS